MIIGLAGEAGVGKTTIARLFRDEVNFEIKTFAAPLKKALQELTGLNEDYFTNIILKEQEIGWIGKSPKQLMQMMGTEFVRNMVHPDFWTRRMAQELLKMNPEDKVIIDDCRFENETALVRDLGGIVIHLEREFECPTTHKAHKSEAILKRFEGDGIIDSGEFGPTYTFNAALGFINRTLQERRKIA